MPIDVIFSFALPKKFEEEKKSLEKVVLILDPCIFFQCILSYAVL